MVLGRKIRGYIILSYFYIHFENLILINITNYNVFVILHNLFFFFTALKLVRPNLANFIHAMVNSPTTVWIVFGRSFFKNETSSSSSSSSSFSSSLLSFSVFSFSIPSSFSQFLSFSFSFFLFFSSSNFLCLFCSLRAFSVKIFSFF